MKLNKNSKLNSFYQKFKEMHVFDDKDIDVLINKFPNVDIKNIPLAWVIPIDLFLTKCEAIAPGAITSITQKYGLIVVKITAVKNKFLLIKNIITDFINDIYHIDFDLYDDLLADINENDIILG